MSREYSIVVYDPYEWLVSKRSSVSSEYDLIAALQNSDNEIPSFGEYEGIVYESKFYSLNGVEKNKITIPEGLSVAMFGL